MKYSEDVIVEHCNFSVCITVRAKDEELEREMLGLFSYVLEMEEKNYFGS